MPPSVRAAVAAVALGVLGAATLVASPWWSARRPPSVRGGAWTGGRRRSTPGT
ncbi:MAG: hypothetical protein R2711_01505 [Acidimicrobiales bacterium]